MSNPKRIPLRQTEVDLLTYCAGDMIPEMKANAELKELRQLAFQHWDKERDEEVQVHVVVVRDPRYFLEPMVTVETT